MKTAWIKKELKKNNIIFYYERKNEIGFNDNRTGIILTFENWQEVLNFRDATIAGDSFYEL